MGDYDGHPFRGNQWTQGGGADRVDMRFEMGSRGETDQASMAEREAAARAITLKVFGHTRVEELADAVGAPDGSIVKVIVGDQKGGPKLSVSVRFPNDDGMMSRSFMVMHPDGRKIALNHAFFLSPDAQGAGIATKVLLEQAEYLSRHGFERIETDAVGSAEMKRVYGDAAPEVGYYTWARMGYEAKVMGPAGVKMPVTELMKTPEGRSWWKDNGHSFEGRFSLKPDSVSMRILRAYAKEKGVK